MGHGCHESRALRQNAKDASARRRKLLSLSQKKGQSDRETGPAIGQIRHESRRTGTHATQPVFCVRVIGKLHKSLIPLARL